MNKLLTTVSALGGVLLASQGYAQATYQSNGIFAQTLYKSYRDLAHLENTSWDIEDSKFLESQSARAIHAPDALELHSLDHILFTQDTQANLAAKKALLEAHLQQGTANTHPVPLARAMSYFDCWVEQQEAEPNVEHNVNSCLNGLNYYLSMLPALQNPVPITQDVVKTRTKNIQLLTTVYFAFDHFDLTQKAKDAIKTIDADLHNADRGQIVITGHADRSGPADYNQTLSVKRANAVANYLQLPKDTFRVESDGVGETQPAVPTADGVKNAANRRVTISVEAKDDQKVIQQHSTTTW